MQSMLEILVSPWLTLVGILLAVLSAVSWMLQPPVLKLKGRHVMVLGANSGIGRAIACHAIMKGARVSILDYDEKQLLNTQEEVQASIPKLICLEKMCHQVVASHIHGSNYEKIEEAVKRAATRLGPVDVLICANADKEACLKLEDLSAVEPSDLETSLRDSVMETFSAIRAVLPGMKGEKPTTINRRIAIVSSITALGGTAGQGVSSCSQFALRALVETLQQELAPYDISISLVCCPLLILPDDIRCLDRPSRMLNDTLSYETSDTIAHATLSAIESGKYIVTFGPLGWLTRVLTCGLSPQPSFPEALAESAVMGMCRLFVVVAQMVLFWRVHPKPVVSKQHVKASNYLAAEKHRRHTIWRRNV